MLLNDGAGLFEPAVNLATGIGPNSVALGDLNGDGPPDIVSANLTANTVSVLLGNGSGGFDPKSDFATGVAPYAVAIRDMNGDGFPDLATANYGAAGVSVLPGNGSGGFGAPVHRATGAFPYSVAIGDVSGDGVPDLAVANHEADKVSLFIGAGGSIAPPGVTMLTSGGSQTCTITPGVGFSILDVRVDGVSQGPVVSHAFTNVTSDHTIDVAFGVNQSGASEGAPATFLLDSVRVDASGGAGLAVVFELPTQAGAQLELLDVAGRQVAGRDVGSLGAGRHTVELAEGRRLASGVYWVRLVQGTDRRVARVVVAR